MAMISLSLTNYKLGKYKKLKVMLYTLSLTNYKLVRVAGGKARALTLTS